MQANQMLDPVSIKRYRLLLMEWIILKPGSTMGTTRLWGSVGYITAAAEAHRVISCIKGQSPTSSGL